MCACVSVSVWSLHVWVCQFGHYRDFEVQHDFLPDASSVQPDPASYLTQGFGPGCWTILCKRREAGIYILCVCVCMFVCVLYRSGCTTLICICILLPITQGQPGHSHAILKRRPDEMVTISQRITSHQHCVGLRITMATDPPLPPGTHTHTINSCRY